jgi:ribosome-associated toxin RatA of RatAB toxin-antitoxin module
METPMQQAASTLMVPASREQVWALLSDVTTVARWNPAVATADLLSDRPTGLHAARRCHFHDGSAVREELVDLDEGRRLRMRLTEYSMPMKSLEAEFALAAAGEGQTEVTFTVHYEVKWGALGRLMGATMVRRELLKMTGRVLAGLRHHLATGETVGKDFVAATA